MKLTERLGRFVLNVVVRPAFRDGETGEERRRKTMLLPGMWVMASLCLCYIPFNMLDGAYSAVVLNIVIIAYSVPAALYMYSTRTLPAGLGAATILVYGFILAVINDIRTYGLIEYYTGGVLVMDAFLLTSSPERYVKAGMATFVLLIVVSTLEQTYHIGLYRSIPTSMTQGYEIPDKIPQSIGMSRLLLRLVVFSADFLLTRHFATGMRSEQARMQAAVEVAQQVASRMVAFDLDGGEEIVSALGHQLPAGLREALEGLLGNLRVYKPFIPQSCLPVECDEFSSSSSEEPSPPDVLSVVSAITTTPSVVANRSDHLSRREVSIVAFNFRRFIRTSLAAGPTRLADFYEGFIGRLLESVSAFHGQCDYVSGDRATVVFNAARACHTHMFKAVQCAMAIHGDMAKLCHGSDGFGALHPALGVSSGAALCGPLGTAGLTRYAIIGGVSTLVYEAERCATRHSTPILVCDTVRSLTLSAFDYRLVEQIQSEKMGGEVHLWCPTGEIELQATEWMYHLGTVRGTWEEYNKVMMALLRGDTDEASLLVQQVDDGGSHYDDLRQRCQQTASPSPRSSPQPSPRHQLSISSASSD
eukprot:Sspe_Gene.73283::Locus_44121_Transcript_1_1_Confidence_1.000_Length_1957::g.73283::m.73283